MANIQPLVKFICHWEGGYSNDPADSGGPTNIGVTLETWKKTGHDKNDDGIINKADLILITHEDMVGVVLKPHYWDYWQADRIQNQSLANLVVDWMWLSGSRTIPVVQQILGVKPDGIVGNQTLDAMNNYPDQNILFDMIKTNRINDIFQICKKSPEKNRFKKGWLNRIASLKFSPTFLIIFLLGLLSSCRTFRSRDAIAIADNPGIQAANRAVTLNVQQQHAAMSDQQTTTWITDSIAETSIIAFKLLNPEDSGSYIMPTQGNGHTIIIRHQKVHTRISGDNRYTGTLQRHDSVTRKAVVSEIHREYPATARTAIKLRIWLFGLLFLLVGTYLYHLFYKKK